MYEYKYYITATLLSNRFRISPGEEFRFNRGIWWRDGTMAPILCKWVRVM